MKRVLVIGDLIADVYHDVRTIRGKFCPDAPDVPVTSFSREETRAGGAANVAANVAELVPDAAVTLIGELSNDVRWALTCAAPRVDLRYSWQGGYRGITKKRLAVDDRLAMRIDRTERDPNLQEMLLMRYEKYLEQNSPDLILLSDYGGGTVGPELLTRILADRDRLLVDTKSPDLSIFSDGGPTFLVKLNEVEWKAVVERDAIPERHFSWMVVTKGAVGAELTWRRPAGAGTLTHSMLFRSHDVPVVDVCGSGDTFFAGLAAGLLYEGDSFAATRWGNAAAATVVSQPRTGIASREKMFELLGKERSR